MKGKPSEDSLAEEMDSQMKVEKEIAAEDGVHNSISWQVACKPKPKSTCAVPHTKYIRISLLCMRINSLDRIDGQSKPPNIVFSIFQRDLMAFLAVRTPPRYLVTSDLRIRSPMLGPKEVILDLGGDLGGIPTKK